MAEKSQMIQTLELTSLPPCAVITGPFPGSLIFFSLPFSKIIFINILNGEKKGEGEEEGGMFRELEKSLSHKLINIFSDTIGCVSHLCANVALPRILASRL